MPHLLEQARSGRSSCRGCGARIGKHEWRFGERLPNPFGDEGTETTHWFHPSCGALMRPEPFLMALSTAAGPLERRDWLEHQARLGLAHRRLSRATGAGRAPSGRAACRACRELIEKGEWRIALRYYQDGRFMPSGFIHLRCANAYLGTTDLTDRLQHFSPELTEGDVAEIRSVLER
jgi:hypothetical protein